MYVCAHIELFNELAYLIVEAGKPDPAKLPVSSSLSSNAWEPRAPMLYVQCEYEDPGEDLCPHLEDRQREKILSYSAFLFIQDFSELDEAYPHLGIKQSALLSLLIQKLILSRNTFTDAHPRLMFNQLLGTLWPRYIDT